MWHAENCPILSMLAHHFYSIGNCSAISIEQKRSAKDAHLAEMKFIASQYRSGAKESLATLCSGVGTYAFTRKRKICGMHVKQVYMMAYTKVE